MCKTAFTNGVITLFLLFLVSPSWADIKTLTITSDTRPVILFEKFGFTQTGHVAIAISNVSLAVPQLNPSRLGFFLLSEESLSQVLLEIQQDPGNFCILDSRHIMLLFTFHDLSLPFNTTYSVTSPGDHSFFFVNCVPESSISMTLHIEFFNLDPNGSRNYLSHGQTNLPSLFFLFSIAYFTFLLFWLHLCYSNKRSLHRIHLFMTLLLLINTLNVFSAGEVHHHVKVTGTPHGWDVLFYIFHSIRVVLLFIVIVLIFLRERGTNVLMIGIVIMVIPLQILASVAFVVISKTGPFIKDWVTWNQVFFLIDLVSCGAIIFLIFCSIRLRYKTHGKAGTGSNNSDKMILMKRFFFLVIGYLFFTRFLMFVLKTFLDYKYRWVSNLAEETVAFAFCVVMLYMFRPMEKEEYFLIDAKEEHVAEIVVKE
ncbi:hypothetical protein VNO77_16246 [Canavalia gladiata]|uniref:Uncharacterized protein n=1 Tax=Canavalia gladiata TaxID=3824 RepID=A0AAN9M5I4_CANGL